MTAPEGDRCRQDRIRLMGIRSRGVRTAAREELTVNIRGMNSLPAERLRSAGKDGHVRPSDGGQDATGVDGRTWEGGIAMDGADAEQVEIGVMSSEQNGECVLGMWSAESR